MFCLSWGSAWPAASKGQRPSMKDSVGMGGAVAAATLARDLRGSCGCGRYGRAQQEALYSSSRIETNVVGDLDVGV